MSKVRDRIAKFEASSSSIQAHVPRPVATASRISAACASFDRPALSTTAPPSKGPASDAVNSYDNVLQIKPSELKLAHGAAFAKSIVAAAHALSSPNDPSKLQAKTNQHMVGDLLATIPERLSVAAAAAPACHNSRLYNRVVAVDGEQNSFVPIVDLGLSADVEIDAAIIIAWRGCSKLRSCMSYEDIYVRAYFYFESFHIHNIIHLLSRPQDMATNARNHFLVLFSSSSDPHGLSADHAASIYMYRHAWRPQ
jgi:hypothetical protein